MRDGSADHGNGHEGGRRQLLSASVFLPVLCVLAAVGRLLLLLLCCHDSALRLLLLPAALTLMRTMDAITEAAAAPPLQ